MYCLPVTGKWVWILLENKDKATVNYEQISIVNWLCLIRKESWNLKVRFLEYAHIDFSYWRERGISHGIQAKVDLKIVIKSTLRHIWCCLTENFIRNDDRNSAWISSKSWLENSHQNNFWICDVVDVVLGWFDGNFQTK